MAPPFGSRARLRQVRAYPGHRHQVGSRTHGFRFSRCVGVPHCLLLSPCQLCSTVSVSRTAAEYEDARDASDAQRARDNYDFSGFRLRVELAKGNIVSSSRHGPASRPEFRADDRYGGGAGWGFRDDHDHRDWDRVPPPRYDPAERCREYPRSYTRDAAAASSAPSRSEARASAGDADASRRSDRDYRHEDRQDYHRERTAGDSRRGELRQYPRGEERRDERCEKGREQWREERREEQDDRRAGASRHNNAEDPARGDHTAAGHLDSFLRHTAGSGGERISAAGAQDPLALRQVLCGFLSRELVEGLRKRHIDVETAVFGEAAIDASLRDPRLLVEFFKAFAKSGGDAAMATVANSWRDSSWTVPTQSSIPVQFSFEGVEWIARVESELTINSCNGLRFANLIVRLATDGCLLRSDLDMQNRGEISTVLRTLHHGRPFFEMTELGASVFRPIRDNMLHLLAASAGEVGVDFIATYCGSEDRIDLKCADRRTPLVVRTVQISFEPGWPADSVPRNHPWPGDHLRGAAQQR